MALTSNFDVLLKEYAPHDLLEREITRLSWVLKKLKKDRSWVPGSNYQIPVELAPGGSFRWGSYASSTDIQQAQVAKPEISAAKALVGSMIFDQADLERHVSLEKSFVASLPKKLTKFVERMNEQINVALLGDGSIATLTANGGADGLCTIGKAGTSYLENGLKIEIDDDNSAALAVYVQDLDTNAGTFYAYDASTGGSAVDISAYTTAQNAKIYLVGGSTSTARPTSLVQLIFSAANGGADTLYSSAITKADSPVYQPYFNDISSSATAVDFMSSIFDSYFEMVEMGRSGVNKEVLLPFHAFKAIAKNKELNKEYMMKDDEVTYGSRAITVVGPDGDMKLRAARGVPTNKAMIVDWDAVSVACYGELIQKGKKVGSESFEIRNSTGYQMLVDKKAEFELIGHNLQALGGLKIATSIT